MIDRVIQVKIIAPPGVGKTILALVIKKALERLGVEVLHSNEEMSPNAFAEYERTCEDKMKKMANHQPRTLVELQEERAFDYFRGEDV